MGPVLIALVLDPLLQHLRKTFSLRIAAILDDIISLRSADSTLRALEFLRSAGPGAGLPIFEDMCLVTCWLSDAYNS